MEVDPKTGMLRWQRPGIILGIGLMFGVVLFGTDTSPHSDKILTFREKMENL